MRGIVPFSILRPLALAAAAIAAGCALLPPPYEERRRVYDPKVSGGVAEADDPDAIALKFAPTATLNSSIDELAAQGFTLERIQLLPEGTDETLLTFRRALPGRGRPTPAPLEFTGLYQDDREPATFYALTPHERGYLLHVIQEGQRQSRIAPWDGRRLRWQEGPDHHELSLSRDGRMLLWRVDTVPPGAEAAVPARTLSARRLRGN